MVRLKVTSEGQMTLDRDLLERLGARPGDELDIRLVDGVSATAPARTGKIEDFFGSLKNVHDVHLSIEELKEATEKGWAGET